MLQSSIGLTAGFALAANAFMIPSTMSAPELSDDGNNWAGLDITHLVEPSRHERIVKLDCKGCAYPVDGEKDVWTTDIANSLVFDFSTSMDGKAIILNGESIFPLDHAVQLKAPQVASDVSEMALAESADRYTTTPRQLDFAVVSRTVEAADGTDAQLVDIDLRVFGIDGVRRDLDVLAIRLLRAEDGKVSMASIDSVPNTRAYDPHSKASDKDETLQILPIDHKAHGKNPVCNSAASFLCKWVAFMEGKIASMRDRMPHHRGGFRGHGRRPCPGRKGSNRKHGVPVKGGVPKFMGWKYGPHKHGEPVPGVDGGEFRDMMIHHDKDGHAPHHHSHHGPHGRHRHPHSALDWVVVSAKVFLFNILVPVLFGVAAGMTAGALGMLVGTIIAWAWIKFVRGGRRGDAQSVAVVVVDEEDIARGDAEEKTGLMAQTVEDVENPPPVYAEKE